MTHGSRASLLKFTPHHVFPLHGGFSYHTGTSLVPGFPFPAPALLTCPHSSVILQYRNINLLSIGYGSRPHLRSRLTQGRSALPWKPWIFGEGVSHPLYRYLYLHLLFHTLQQSSRFTFDAEWNAPLPILTDPIASVNCLMPDYYPRQTPRLVSCYALFK